MIRLKQKVVMKDEMHEARMRAKVIFAECWESEMQEAAYISGSKDMLEAVRERATSQHEAELDGELNHIPDARKWQKLRSKNETRYVQASKQNSGKAIKHD